MYCVCFCYILWHAVHTVLYSLTLWRQSSSK
jgi:hypothetical protein